MNTCCIKNERQYKIGGIALGGVWFKTIENGYAVNLTTYVRNVEKELHRLEDGGYFVDFRNEESGAITAHIAGPMLDLCKPVDYKEHENPGALSFVGLNYYLKNALDNGAKVGKRNGDNMEWSDGSVTPIEPCKCYVNRCPRCGMNRPYGYAGTVYGTGPTDYCCKKGR